MRGTYEVAITPSRAVMIQFDISEKPQDSDPIHESFMRQVKRHARYEKVLIIFWVLGMTCIVTVVPFGIPQGIWNQIFTSVFFSLWLSFVLILLLMPNLRCPKCGAKVAGAVDRFCPECGSLELDLGGWFQEPRCRSCAVSLRRTRRGGGTWRIRICTHCGVSLGKSGV
jgi:zinc ribbon protein